jgi:hypothetical protein
VQHPATLSKSDRAPLLIFALGVAVLFFIANRGAYRGFFSDDDFDNIANARGTEFSYYIEVLLKPSVSGDHIFRPAAHAYYWLMSRAAGLHYRPYVAGIQILHLVNVVLIWMLLRSLRASVLGASAGALLFAFHMAVFGVYWKPMFVFDLACGTFTLATLLAYVRGRLILSLAFFWLALKSKELAILLPIVLAGYEWWFGGKRWKRLALFFAITAVLGVQALLINAGRGENQYSLRFTPGDVWTCARFYSSQLLLAPGFYGLAGFAIVVVPFFIRNRLVRFGVFSFVFLLAVMLVLPGRLVGAYLYTPLIGLAIALSAATRPAWLAVFFAAWIPWNYYNLRIDRKSELAGADERRAWFQPVANFMSTHGDTDTFVYDGAPESLAPFGVTAAFRVLRDPDATTTVVEVDAPEEGSALAMPHLAVVLWDEQVHNVTILPRSKDVPYLRVSRVVPLWQLEDGWIDRDANFRWIGPHATARLLRPAVARAFEVVVYVPAVYIDQLHRGTLEVRVDHQPIGTGVLDKAVPTTFHFDVPPSKEGTVEVEFTVSPPLKDPSGSSKYYGAPIAAFGFVQ